MGGGGAGPPPAPVSSASSAWMPISTASEEVKDRTGNYSPSPRYCTVVVTAIYLLVAVAAVGAQEQGLFQHQISGFVCRFWNM
ncbi:MAG: hypothetical protein U1U88_001508 [Lawsonella clevelandensis]